MGLAEEGRGPPGSDKLEDKADRDRDKDYKDEHARKSLSKFDRLGKLDKELEAGHDDSMEESLGNQKEADDIPAIPIAAFHPVMGMVPIQQDEINEAKEGCGIQNIPDGSTVTKEIND